jgi:hypothetical protein
MAGATKGLVLSLQTYPIPAPMAAMPVNTVKRKNDLWIFMSFSTDPVCYYGSR